MGWQLLTKEKALELLSEMGQGGQLLDISVGEDLCFGKTSDNWVNVGKIRLFPDRIQDANPIESRSEVQYDETCAVQFGGFEWCLPDEPTLRANHDSALGDLNLDQKNKIWKFFRQGLQDVLRRTLLLLPVFDADAISRLPLRRPITIVPDTSAIHQGAIDFICRFLVPWARVKVPATVHMELVQNSDNYFKGIRWNQQAWKDGLLKDANRAQALAQHLLSQGGQRTLIRLEFDADAEIERGDLGTDPLRSILQIAKDPQDKDLGMFDVVKSFGDRLILETARRFRTQVRPDHPLAILTSDQGMARMAMAEGMDVFFFQARAVPQFFSKRLTGTLFHPFKPELYTVSLVSVLWELAVSFGCLRLSNPLTGMFLELWGIVPDEAATWQPLHAKEDLLWARFQNIQTLPQSEPVYSPSGTEIAVEDAPSSEALEDGNDKSVVIAEVSDVKERTSLTGAYKFSPSKMLDFIEYVQEKDSLTDAEGQEVLGLTRKDFYRNYKNFLRSGQFVYLHGEDTVAADTLKAFWQALLIEDTATVLNCLLKVPSFRQLYEFVERSGVVEEGSRDYPIAPIAVPNYLNLGEAATAWITIPEIGVVFTGNHDITLEKFAEVALTSYQQLRDQEKTDWILTGQWLETVARQYAIHPVIARRLVAQTRTENQLQVYVEGSTPDTRFERHTMWVLKSAEDKPTLVKVYLYHGDFLMPGTASVRVKIQGVNHAT